MSGVVTTQAQDVNQQDWYRPEDVCIADCVLHVISASSLFQAAGQPGVNTELLTQHLFLFSDQGRFSLGRQDQTTQVKYSTKLPPSRRRDTQRIAAPSAGSRQLQVVDQGKPASRRLLCPHGVSAPRAFGRLA